MKNVTKSQLKELVYKVNGAAIEVHKCLGPGLLESVYHQCMLWHLNLKIINNFEHLTQKTYITYMFKNSLKKSNI